MKKTFCDRCGKQCVNTTVVISVRVVHHTKTGEYVGDDEHKPIEVCTDCEYELRQLFPQAFSMIQKDEALIDSPVAAEYRRVEERR